MSGLVEKLSAAEVGSRALDGAVWYAVHEPDVDHGRLHVEQTEQGPIEVLTCELGSKYADCVGNYTTSLDAALALAERVHPCWAWSVGKNIHHGYWLAYALALGEDRAPVQTTSANARTPALALCIAICRALNLNETRHAE